jgi:hypothetical protein
MTWPLQKIPGSTTGQLSFVITLCLKLSLIYDHNILDKPNIRGYPIEMITISAQLDKRALNIRNSFPDQ